MSDTQQHDFWYATFAGPEYFYGADPGPVARRAVRYHRPLWRRNAAGMAPTALDAGCGEGQDLAFVVAEGYRASGVDFTQSGAAKTRRLLQERGLEAEVLVRDLRECRWFSHFDLVLAVNSLQFLGEDAPMCLEHVRDAVAPCGVIGLSLFARCENKPRVQNGVYFWTMDELLEYFPHQGEERCWQMLETTQLWQWNTNTNQPQPFLSLIAQRIT